ncbi:bifunctional phosphoribosylaminoimidazolecarboxamide formyltransferase/IMP cyclohydrolase [Peptoniphilus sp. GNH]|nr:phosphoribosylaminoimidazolecarboxamide formyltransferase/IMP cyclohydrolase [Clostridiales bacterium KA00134]UHR02107.1 bifunctional phosphoribosylaminoimidazolecarboxamide formyltransferase/IMP cyclohydrolase [Peptoniphilus sp. GNH]
MRKALISVSDKTGVDEFARGLIENGFEIISTGGTLKYLKDKGIACMDIADYTGFSEILEGRVKTLHPKVHGGLLAKRDQKSHQKELKDNNIDYIDLICVNLYPFFETLKKAGVSDEEIIENIDIGGPSMLRSAAKNYKFVTVVTDIKDYEKVLKELRENKDTSLETRQRLAFKVFKKTSEYDAMIAKYFEKKIGIEDTDLSLHFKLKDELRYGENPHQKARHYISDEKVSYAMQDAIQLHGKKMSYNNIQDASAALDILQEFDQTVCVALKHMNPCGVALGKDVYEAYTRAYEADPVSIFGGIVAINGKIDKKTAEKMHEIFLEIILAEDYEEEALEILKEKKNLRIYKIPKKIDKEPLLIKSVRGGILVQDYDDKLYDKFEVITEKKPNEAEIKDMEFGYKIVKHIKSNAVVVVKNGQTLGVGAGQMNRVGSCKIAFEQAGAKAEGAVLASDAFFPYSDSVELASKYKISSVIQPGGSIRDQESIDACNRHNIAMVFTGMRHFKH